MAKKKQTVAEAVALAPFSSQLRAAIRSCGMSAGQLSREVKIPVGTICNFLNGTDMRLSNADKLGVYFGFSCSWTRG